MRSTSPRPGNSRTPSTPGSMGGWRSAALAKFAKVKDYVASSEVSKSAYAAVSNRVIAYKTGVDPVTGQKRQTWEEWARERRQRRREEQRGAEKLALFPGWAVRRYPNDSVPVEKGDVQRFTIDIFISGFASSLRTPEQATRSQKAFMRLARGFSALPRLPPTPESILGGSGMTSPLTQSPNPSADDLTEELARMGVILPPRPDDITAETEAQALQYYPKPKVQNTRDYRIVDYGTNNSTSTPTPASKPNSRPQSPPLPARSPTITTQAPSPMTSPIRNIRSNTADSMLSVNSTRSNTDVGSIHPEMDVGILRQLHANLDERLQPFWSSKLDNREIRVALYAQPPESSARHQSQDPGPLATTVLRTNPQGYFSHTFSLSFEDLCTHDQTLHVAFGDHKDEYSFSVRAELLPATYASNSNGAGATRGIGIERNIPNESVRVQAEMPLTSARVRLISDIDDTVKISEVLMGVRAIFHNVFVRHLDELVVPGMPELYSTIASRGVRFHYVSNGPFELLPVLMNFFEVAGLPRGSVKLKSYGGRSLFQGLWGESAADRKRGNVIEVLDSFPQSKFILVGDTGEQDLELYSALAEERPQQILALFLRDVTPPTPPPTAPPSPALGPVGGNTVKKKGSSSSLRSLRSLTGGGKQVKEEAPKVQIPRTSQDSTGNTSRPSTPRRFGMRSVTDPVSPSTSSPSTPYQVYAPRARGASGSYFEIPTSPRTRRAGTPSLDQFAQANRDIGVDPAGALVSAAATAGTGHSVETAVDTTRAGILAKKEALKLRVEAARARVPPEIVLRVFREPSECEDDVMRVIDSLGRRYGSSWNTEEELMVGRK